MTLSELDTDQLDTNKVYRLFYEGKHKGNLFRGQFDDGYYESDDDGEDGEWIPYLQDEEWCIGSTDLFSGWEAIEGSGIPNKFSNAITFNNREYFTWYVPFELITVELNKKCCTL